MEISVERDTAGTPVTIMRLAGELDASNYREVIARVQALYAEGARRLLLDLSDVTFLSSAGLVALHSAALILRGQAPPDPEEGWNVFHTMSDEVEKQVGPDPHLRLLNPQPRVARVLDTSGFSRLLAVDSDRQAALAAFRAAPA